jgi:F-type H+-transporting ATPase subunit a
MLFKNIEQYNLFINSPLEQFEITSLLSLNAPLFGYINLTITNLTLYSFIILYLISYLHVFANNNFKLLPSK